MKLNYDELLSDPKMFEAFRASGHRERSEILSSIYDSIKYSLEKYKKYDEVLHASIFIGLCESFGGTQVYLPSKSSLCKAISELAIYNEFNGKNKKELSLKYRISNRTIDTIVERHRKYSRMAREHLHGMGIKHD